MTIFKIYDRVYFKGIYGLLVFGIVTKVEDYDDDRQRLFIQGDDGYLYETLGDRVTNLSNESRGRRKTYYD